MKHEEFLLSPRFLQSSCSSLGYSRTAWPNLNSKLVVLVFFHPCFESNVVGKLLKSVKSWINHSLEHIQTHTHTFSLFFLWVLVIWQWPSGSFFLHLCQSDPFLPSATSNCSMSQTYVWWQGDKRTIAARDLQTHCRYDTGPCSPVCLLPIAYVITASSASFPPLSQTCFIRFDYLMMWN